MKIFKLYSSPFFLLLPLFLFLLGIQQTEAAVEAIFIFGDSTVDVGTNNFLPISLARADFPYNGIDFIKSNPTGRFSNGYNSADHIVRLMGYKRSPSPFLYLLNTKTSRSFKKKILRGVNFASAGSGILYHTGLANWVQVISFTDQIQQFKTVYGNITMMKGKAATATMLSKCLFLISIGSNDILDHYRLNISTTKQELMASLQSAYYNHLKSLYELGARKIGIISVPPIGCCPFARVSNNGSCLEVLNDFAWTFYTMIEALLQRLTSELKEMKYSLANTYNMTMSIIENQHSTAFKDVETACCGKGKLNAESSCYDLIEPNLCSNRNKYLFWDLYHPTSAATKLAAQTLYNGDATYMTPINFRRLAEI